jgi:hypothetical protein
MKLPNLEKALIQRAGSIDNLFTLVQTKGADSFTIHEKPYQPFHIEAQWWEPHMIVWAFFSKEVNGDTCMDPLVKYRCTRSAEGLDFTPFYWETFPFPPCQVVEGESDILHGMMNREELEEFVNDWDVEFGTRGWAAKVVPASVERKPWNLEDPDDWKYLADLYRATRGVGH